MDTSIIITTYNWPEALTLSLDSILRQSVQDIQIVIADDGSNEHTAQIVEKVLGPSDRKWIHVRHADIAVRQSRIKNLAVKHATGKYLIFSDHDVILHPEFIADHLAFAQKRCFLQGKRVLLTEKLTQKILITGAFVPIPPYSPGIKNRKNTFRCPALGRTLIRPKKFQTSLRGCNFSVYKEDYLEVDGFDEVFDGMWGREDSDICYRLFHFGSYVKNLWFTALQYHLSHKAIKNKAIYRLDFELQKNRQEKRIKAIHGLSKLSDEGKVVASS
ncbi:MAG: glycosyltransferase [Desulfobacterales bacterium]